MKKWTFREFVALAVVISAIGIVSPSAANGAVSWNYDPGTTMFIPTVSAVSTGSTMAGMEVTATFLDGSSEMSLWVATGATAGQASGAAWTLAQAADTSVDEWSLVSTVAIKKLHIETLPGDTVLDKSTYDYKDEIEGTTGSSVGTTFIVHGQSEDWNIRVTYRDLVALSGSSPFGDLYAVLDIEFTDAGGFGGTRPLHFSMDTDTVPEPAMLSLLAAGGLAVLRRRRKK